MKKLNLFDIYQFGQALVPLKQVDHDWKIKPFAFELYHAYTTLAPMASNRSPLLETARRAAQTLLDALARVNAHDLPKLFDTSDDEDFGWRASGIKTSLSSLESVLTNDMPGIACYLVAQKGIYKTEDLIARADWAIPDDILKSVPDKARKDFCESGKCLAYELSTACGFHLWRAVEGALEMYYEKLTGKTLEADGVQSNWGAYIKALQDKKADLGVTGFLDHIRKNHRNPTMHPEVTLDLNEALALFDVGKSAIQQMVIAIQKLPTPAALPALVVALVPGSGSP